MSNIASFKNSVTTTGNPAAKNLSYVFDYNIIANIPLYALRWPKFNF
jgi:hypothetical protein